MKDITNTHRPTTRVLDILMLLSVNPEGLNLTEIAQKIGAPKSSLVPVIRTMNSYKFIHQNKKTSKYTIGINCYSTGASFLTNVTPLSYIRYKMQDIVKNTDEICQLGIRDHDCVLYIAKEDCSNSIRLISNIGKRLPLYCTAIGKALLLDMDYSELRDLLPDKFEYFTDKTIRNVKLLSEQLFEAKKTGITSDNEEVGEHITCAAVPIRVKDEIVAAISVSIPNFRATEEKLKTIKKILKDTEFEIEKHLSTTDTDLSSLRLE